MIKKISETLDKAYDRGYKGISAFMDNKQASISGSAISILVLLVTLMLCALLFGVLQGQTSPKITALGDANATASYGNIVSTGWSSIDLFGLVPYVAVFIIIIGLLLGIGGERRR